MITIICATNRPKNQTLKVVEVYKTLIEEQGHEVSVFQMAELPSDFIVTDTFGNRTDKVSELIQEKIVPAEKLVIIAPEYNGSYPGVFKAFLDGVSPSLWHGKKAALVGVATGRAGNLRGMDHLTHVLHHLKVEVFSAKVPISKLDSLLDEDGTLVDATTVEVLRNQLDGFLKF
ncbi:MAG: NAD(P)H-dependent oxidoreductase [Flavobacteriia bacterium]|nr:NAD(P)H-dependent oxidoreductase [Flavobacteriia bacterium]